MADLNDLLGACGDQKPSGTEVRLYYCCTCEMNGFPQTEKQLGNNTPGANIRLGEAFDFSTAPSGSGYWRSATILIDTGGLKMMKEGEVGGENLASGIRFYIVGTEAEQIEFAENLVKISGCLSAMLKQRESDYQTVVGTKMIPAVIESLEMDGGEKSGERVGTAYSIRCSSKPYHYNDSVHGIDITPNP